MTSKKQKFIFNKNTTVSEIVDVFPFAADILMGYGLHCVGCFANSFETLEQGVLGHGYSSEELYELIDDLNEAYEENKSIKEEKNKRGEREKKEKNISNDADKMKISVTKKALKKIENISNDEGKEGWSLRIDAQSFGKKLKYSMDFVEQKETSNNDKEFIFDSVKIVINKGLYVMLNGLEIDYLKEENREGFKMNNPNIEK